MSREPLRASEALLQAVDSLADSLARLTAAYAEILRRLSPRPPRRRRLRRRARRS